MQYLTLARVIHVIADVLWIGGEAMVTTVIIPAVRRMKSKEDRGRDYTLDANRGRLEGGTPEKKGYIRISQVVKSSQTQEDSSFV